jgi:hypothetical protein
MEISCDVFKCKGCDDSDELEELAETRTAADGNKHKEFNLRKAFEDVFDGDNLICIKGNFARFS